MKYVLSSLIALIFLTAACHNDKDDPSHNDDALKAIDYVELKDLTADQKKAFLPFLKKIDAKKLALAYCDLVRLQDTEKGALCQANHTKCVKAANDHVASDELSTKANQFIETFKPSKVKDIRDIFSLNDEINGFESQSIKCGMSKVEVQAYEGKRDKKFSADQLNRAGDFSSELFNKLTPNFVTAL